MNHSNKQVASVSRRQFLAGSMGAAGVAALPLSVSAREHQTETPLINVIYDEKLSASKAFAVTAAAAGVPVQALAGDSFRFGRSVFKEVQSGSVVAGMCSYGDFILLSDAAKDAGFKVIAQAHHQRTSTLAHVCSGEFAGLEDMLVSAGVAWPLALAESVSGARQSFSGSLVLAPVSEPLVSWLVQKR